MHHLSIANGSLMELETQLLIASRRRYITTGELEPVLELSRVVGEVRAPGGGMNNRFVLITGTSRGIGRATALRLASAGMAVIVTYEELPLMGRSRRTLDRRALRADVFRLDHDLPKGTPLPNGQVVQATKIFYFRQTRAAFYFQDNWKLRPSLTLNLGLRYEFLTDAEEDNGNFANLRHITDPQTTVGLYFRNPTKKNFSPRIGFAWSPKDHKSAIRGGAGQAGSPCEACRGGGCWRQ